MVRDLEDNICMNKQKFNQLQGLRVFAIFLVVACHIPLQFDGGISNVIFFCLSGFLLVKPFSKVFRIESWKELVVFYLKKIVTIIIPYWIFITLLMFLMKHQMPLIWGHWHYYRRAMLFYDAPGHLWFLQQLVLMYFISPIFIFIHMLLTKYIKWDYINLAYGAFLLGLALITRQFLSSDVFYLLTGGEKAPFRIHSFLVGMAFAYFYSVIVQKEIKISFKLQQFLCVIPLSILVFAMISGFIFGPRNIAIGWSYQYCTAVFASIMIVMLVWCNDSWLCKILSFKPLVEIGNITFSIYILHFFFMPYIRPVAENDGVLLIGTFILSMGVGYLFQKAVFDKINFLCNKYVYPSILKIHKKQPTENAA